MNILYCQNVMNSLKHHRYYQLQSISILVLDIASLASSFYQSRMCLVMSFITVLMDSSGRLVLWLPLKIQRYFLPEQRLCSFYELSLSISLSSSPLMNIIKVDLSIFFTSYLISSCSMSYLPFSWMSARSLQNTHGKKQLIRHPGTYLGEFYLAICLHRLLKHRKDESATIIGAFPYLRAVAAPILLPQIITLNPFFSKKWTIVSTCFDSLTPRLIMSSSWLRPQPIKSNEAREKRQGKYLMMPVDQRREDEFPWRQRMIHSDRYSGSNILRVMTLSSCLIIVSFLSYLVSFSTNTLDPIWYQVYPMSFIYSWNAEDAECRQVVFATSIIILPYRCLFSEAALPTQMEGSSF